MWREGMESNIKTVYIYFFVTETNITAHNKFNTSFLNINYFILLVMYKKHFTAYYKYIHEDISINRIMYGNPFYSYC